MSNRIPDINGWITIPRNPIAKAGVFPYSKRATQAPGWEQDPTGIVMVYRPEAELASPETMESVKLLPWIDGHTMIGDPTWQEGLTPPEVKGISGTIGEEIEYDSDTRTLYANIRLWSTSLEGTIDGGKRELSMGFRCRYEFANGNFEGEPYQAIQHDLRGNHMASVMAGRMGSDIAVLDELTFTFDAKEVFAMVATPKKVKRSDRIAAKFGIKPGEVAAFVAALDADDTEDAPASSGGGDMTLAEVAAMMKEVAPAIAGIKDMLTSMSTAGEPDGDEGDMEPVLDAAGAPMMDPAGKPKMQKKVPPAVAADGALPSGSSPGAKAIAAQDSAEFRKTVNGFAAVVGKLATAMDGLNSGVTLKALTTEASRRDKLASRASEFIGAFDASEMSYAEVGAYAVDKLAIPNVPKGSEASAVEAFLHGRVAPRVASTFVLDANEGNGSAAGRKAVNDFFSGATV